MREKRNKENNITTFQDYVLYYRGIVLGKQSGTLRFFYFRQITSSFSRLVY